MSRILPKGSKMPPVRWEDDADRPSGTLVWLAIAYAVIILGLCAVLVAQAVP